MSNTSSCVILLHGLVRSAKAMEPLSRALDQQGFYSVNEDYPSRHHSIEVLADKAINSALEKCPKGLDINFVTHSLGGILVRQYLSKRSIERLNRVVMLGPPNQGSEVVDKLKHVLGFRFMNGPAGMQLGTDEASVPKTLGGANFELGVIAGTRSINWGLSSLIPSTDDGKVSVESTKIEGMADHIEMSVTHPFMMKNKQVIEQVIFFLRNGSFNH